MPTLLKLAPAAARDAVCALGVQIHFGATEVRVAVGRRRTLVDLELDDAPAGRLGELLAAGQVEAERVSWGDLDRINRAGLWFILDPTGIPGKPPESGGPIVWRADPVPGRRPALNGRTPDEISLPPVGPSFVAGREALELDRRRLAVRALELLDLLQPIRAALPKMRDEPSAGPVVAMAAQLVDLLALAEPDHGFRRPEEQRLRELLDAPEALARTPNSLDEEVLASAASWVAGDRLEAPKVPPFTARPSSWAEALSGEGPLAVLPDAGLAHVWRWPEAEALEPIAAGAGEATGAAPA